ncbi:MAG: hypothetical protein ACI835_001262 [Planctomycetota bacterium]|jgi:hypothetical protein
MLSLFPSRCARHRPSSRSLAKRLTATTSKTNRSKSCSFAGFRPRVIADVLHWELLGMACRIAHHKRTVQSDRRSDFKLALQVKILRAVKRRLAEGLGLHDDRHGSGCCRPARSA